MERHLLYVIEQFKSSLGLVHLGGTIDSSNSSVNLGTNFKLSFRGDEPLSQSPSEKRGDEGENIAEIVPCE
jgi:hypothetical protein